MYIRKHASIRMQERCSLSENELKNLLQSGKYYPIGRDDVKRHEHKMIYSELDNEFLVVVEDYDNHDIITILTLDYHNAWLLSPDILELAQKSLMPKSKRSSHKVESVNSAKIFVRIASEIEYKKIYKVIKKTRQDTVKVCDLSIIELIAYGYPDNLCLTIDNFRDIFLNNFQFRNSVKSYILLKAGDIVPYSAFSDKFVIEGYLFCFGGDTLSMDVGFNYKKKA